MEVGKSFETLVMIYWTTWRHIQGDATLGVSNLTADNTGYPEAEIHIGHFVEHYTNSEK
jgi:hypothetical protein